MNETPSASWWPWVAALLAVALLAAGGWWFLGRGSDWNPLAMLRPVVNAPTATVTNTVTPWVVTATPQPTMTPTLPLPTPTSDLLPLPTPTVPASPTPTPRPTATPESVAQIAMELRATQRAWVRVTVDGQVAEEGSLEGGAVRNWEANESIAVRTGNGGGVVLLLNGEDLGPMGNVGEVVERTWVVAEGEVTESTGSLPTSTPSPTPAG